MNLSRFKLLIIVNILLIAVGCKQGTLTIPLQTVIQTSEKLNCEKVFNKNRKSIIELNEILVQTGTVDNDNDILQAAIIHAGGNEILLNLDKAQKQGNSVEETYKGQGYKIILTYELEQFTHASGYKGYVEIWKGSDHDKFPVQGIDNIL